MKLWQKIFLGMILGGIAGFFLGGNKELRSLQPGQTLHDEVVVSYGNVKKRIKVDIAKEKTYANIISFHDGVASQDVKDKVKIKGKFFLPNNTEFVVVSQGHYGKLKIDKEGIWKYKLDYSLARHLKPIGDLFINLIKMIVVPLIFFSICAAITSMEKAHSLKRVAGKSIFLFLLSTVVAILISFIFANAFDPSAGVNVAMFSSSGVPEPQAVSFIDTIVNMIPTNPIKAMADGNVMQVIVFAFFFGTAVNITGKKVSQIARALDSVAEVIYSLTGIIMAFAPYGVFALIGWVVGTQNPEILFSLMKLVAVVIAACVVHTLVFYSTILKFVAKVSPIKFYKQIFDALVLAFSTSSSSAALPVTMKVAEEKLGVSKGTTNFVVPLGSTIHMDGTAIYIGICTIFVAGLTPDVTLGMMDYANIMFTTTLLAIGTAGIPGVSLIMMTIIFASIGLPIEAIAIIAGVDRILDMVRTTVNVTGDLAIAVVVDKSEGSFNQAIFDEEQEIKLVTEIK